VKALASAMEINETITVVTLDMWTSSQCLVMKDARPWRTFTAFAAGTRSVS